MKLGSPLVSGLKVNHSQAWCPLWVVCVHWSNLRPKTHLLGPKGTAFREQRVELEQQFSNVRAMATRKPRRPHEGGLTGMLGLSTCQYSSLLQQPFPEFLTWAGLGSGDQILCSEQQTKVLTSQSLCSNP